MEGTECSKFAQGDKCEMDSKKQPIATHPLDVKKVDSAIQVNSPCTHQQQQGGKRRQLGLNCHTKGR
jgi:hypothetical protein